MTTPSSAADEAILSGPTPHSVALWVKGYLKAWESNSAGDIAELFTEDAEYHETPYETEWIGRDEIVDGWRGRWNWQKGGWRFEWSLVSIEGHTVVVAGIGHYTQLGDFDNVWTISFDDQGRVSRFEMVNNERV